MVIHTEGKVTQILDIIIDDVKEDGTIEKITTRMEPGKRYSVISVSPKDGCLYTVNGNYEKFLIGMDHNMKEFPACIILDTSTKCKQTHTKIDIAFIKAVSLIEEL